MRVSVSACFHQLLSCFFFTYLIQSSRLSSWLVVFFSWSSLNENLLSWSHSLCVLISSGLLADFVMTNVFSSSFLLDFVFFVRLYDDTKRFRVERRGAFFFVFFCSSPSPVSSCRCDNDVEQV